MFVPETAVEGSDMLMTLANERANVLSDSSESVPEEIQASVVALMTFNAILQSVLKMTDTAYPTALTKYVNSLSMLVSQILEYSQQLTKLLVERELLAFEISRTFRLFHGLKLNPKKYGRMIDKRTLKALMKKTRIVKGESPEKSREKVVKHARKLLAEMEDNAAYEQVYLSKIIQAKMQLAEMLSAEDSISQLFFQEFMYARNDDTSCHKSPEDLAELISGTASNTKKSHKRSKHACNWK